MDKIENLHDGQSITKLQEMIKSIGVCMFFTNRGGKKGEVRPMSVADVDDEGNIWFLAGKSSEKVENIRFDNDVHLVFAHPGKEMYLYINGTAEIKLDKKAIKRIWTPFAKAWFTYGADDPDLCAIKVKPEGGNYWDTQHGKLVEFLSIISSVVTGKKSGDGVSGQIEVN
jgi:general stress protein 26